MMTNNEQLTDLELLSTALREAMEAQQNGMVIGPAVNELSLRRAERRALGFLGPGSALLGGEVRPVQDRL